MRLVQGVFSRAIHVLYLDSEERGLINQLLLGVEFAEEAQVALAIHLRKVCYWLKSMPELWLYKNPNVPVSHCSVGQEFP